MQQKVLCDDQGIWLSSRFRFFYTVYLILFIILRTVVATHVRVCFWLEISHLFSIWRLVLNELRSRTHRYLAAIAIAITIEVDIVPFDEFTPYLKLWSMDLFWALNLNLFSLFRLFLIILIAILISMDRVLTCSVLVFSLWIILALININLNWRRCHHPRFFLI